MLRAMRILDLFPVEISLYFKLEKSFKAIPGAIGSLLATLSIIVVSILLIYQFFSRERIPALIQDQQFINNPLPTPVDNKTLEFSLELMDISTVSTKEISAVYNNIRQIKFNKLALFDQNRSNFDYSVGKFISVDKITGPSVVKDINAKSYNGMFNLSQLFTTVYTEKLSLGGSLIDGNYDFIESRIMIDICAFSKTCQNGTGAENLSYFMIFSNSFFNLSNDQGFSYDLSPFKTDVLPGTDTILNLYYKINEVTTNDNLFYDNQIKTTFFSFDSPVFNTVQTNEIPISQSRLRVNFLMSPYKMSYIRTYPKLITLLANINALVGVIVIICRTIVRFFANSYLDLTMINSLYTFNSKRDDLENNDFPISIKSKTLMQRPRSRKSTGKGTTKESNSEIVKFKITSNSRPDESEELPINSLEYILFFSSGLLGRCFYEAQKVKLFELVNHTLKSDLDVVNILKKIHVLSNYIEGLPRTKNPAGKQTNNLLV